MKDIHLIDIRQAILSDNDNEADKIRAGLKEHKTFMLNLMASPGAGKTSLVMAIIKALSPCFKIGVIEGDIDSIVDAEKVSEQGVPVVQLRTGGACHLDAPMIAASLEKLNWKELDLVIIENIGNLVCPAEFDTGANVRVMMTSVPEGDDKVLKYPLMFSVCEALVINKIDYLPDPGFDIETLKKRVRNLNKAIEMFPLSCRKGEGVQVFTDWLAVQIEEVKA